MRSVSLAVVFLTLISAQQPREQSEQEKKARDTYEGAYDPSKPPVFNQEPNEFLMDSIKGRKPGLALDVGMGNGRNSIALAQKGWNVTGFDLARAGVEQANEEAAQLGVSLTTCVQSDRQFDFGTARWDLVVLTYQPFKAILNRVKSSLKEGGLVVLENFANYALEKA